MFETADARLAGQDRDRVLVLSPNHAEYGCLTVRGDAFNRAAQFHPGAVQRPSEDLFRIDASRFGKRARAQVEHVRGVHDGGEIAGSRDSLHPHARAGFHRLLGAALGVDEDSGFAVLHEEDGPQREPIGHYALQPDGHLAAGLFGGQRMDLRAGGQHVPGARGGRL